MYQPQEPKDGPKRLSEPAEGTPKSYASGGYVGTGPVMGDPDKGCYIPGGRVELDAAAFQNLTQSITNQKGYLQ